MTEYISAMEHDINNRKETCQSIGTPYKPPNFVIFGPEIIDDVKATIDTAIFLSDVDCQRTEWRRGVSIFADTRH